ncbi:MAG: lysoplasmalogenase [Dermatophilaceae bacterium]|nr:lysoplasmalogenase [Dermatophilaceae bacterium]
MASHWSLPATRALTAYLMLAVANLVAIAVGASLLSNWTQWLLMPILTIAFVALARGATGLDPRLRTATLAALGFSWLGDLLPHLAPDSVAFLVMVGCFLLAQVAYIVGFLPHWRRSVLVTARPLAALYAVVFVALIAACAGGAGPLLGPVVVYGLTLTAMAVLATGLGRLTGLGGALFMLSDSLIALKAFREWDGRALSMAVMGTYAAAQALLVMGIVRQTAPPVTH